MRIKQRSIALVAATALLLTGMQVVAPVATADPEVVVGSTSSLESSAREMVQVDLTAEEQGASQLCSPYRSYIRIRSEMAIDYLNYGEYSPMFASPVNNPYTITVYMVQSDGSACLVPATAYLVTDSPEIQADRFECTTDENRNTCEFVVTAQEPGIYPAHVVMADPTSGDLVNLNVATDIGIWPFEELFNATSFDLRWVSPCSGDHQVSVSPNGPITIGQYYSVTVSDDAACLYDMFWSRPFMQLEFPTSPEGPTAGGEYCTTNDSYQLVCTVRVASDVAGKYDINASYISPVWLDPETLSISEPDYPVERLLLLKEPVTLEWIDRTDAGLFSGFFNMLSALISALIDQIFEIAFETGKLDFLLPMLK